MATTRRKRTDEEQRLYDEIEALKRQKSDQAIEVTRCVDRMFSVGPDGETDAILGARAREALAARRAVDEIGRELVSLQTKYEALRARATEDVPI